MDIGDKVAKVGWTTGITYSEAPYPLVAIVALKNETGFIQPDGRPVPPRPFLRMTISKYYLSWLFFMEQGAKHLLENEGSFEQVLLQVGNEAVADIRQTVADFVPPALSPYTIQKRLEKKSSKALTDTLMLPLLDSGFMMATLENRVEEE